MSIFGEKRLLSGAIRQRTVARLVVAKVTDSVVRESRSRRATANTPGAYGSRAIDVRNKFGSKIRISGTYAPMQDWITIAQIGTVNAKRNHIAAVSTA
jgi:hypothetical protein